MLAPPYTKKNERVQVDFWNIKKGGNCNSKTQRKKGKCQALIDLEKLTVPECPAVSEHDHAAQCTAYHERQPRVSWHNDVLFRKMDVWWGRQNNIKCETPKSPWVVYGLRKFWEMPKYIYWILLYSWLVLFISWISMGYSCFMDQLGPGCGPQILPEWKEEKTGHVGQEAAHMPQGLLLTPQVQPHRSRKNMTLHISSPIWIVGPFWNTPVTPEPP